MLEEFKVGNLTVRIIPDPDLEAMNPREDSTPVGKMVCWHPRYNLGDEQPRGDPEEWLNTLLDEETEERIERLSDIIDRYTTLDRDRDWNRVAMEGKEHTVSWAKRKVKEISEKFLEDNYVILPLYLYDHSGLTMNTSGFSCQWDSGQVGYIYVSMDNARKEFSGTGDPTARRKKPRGIQRYWDEEVREWAEKYLKGEVKEYDQYLRGDVWGFVIEDEDGEEVGSCWGFYGREYCIEQAKEAAEAKLEMRPQQIELKLGE